MTGLFRPVGSLPLDSADGLGREVQQDAVDALYLMGDAVGDLVEDLVGDLLDGGGHGILGIDSTDDGGPAFVTALVLNADTLNIGHSDEVLPDLFSQTALVEFLTQDGVGLTQSLQTVTGATIILQAALAHSAV